MKPSADENHGTKLLENSSTLLVDATSARTTTHDQLRHPCFVDHSRLVSFLSNLLHQSESGHR